MGILVYILSGYFLPFVGLYKWYETAGEPGWAALVPGYNVYTAIKITGAPKWWMLLALVPIVHIFIIAGLLIELNRSFGRYNFGDNAAAIILPYVYHLYQAKKGLEYLRPAWAVQNDLRKRYRVAVKNKDKAAQRRIEKEDPFPKKTKTREWAESIIFAVFAAHFIRLFLIEAYTIPTPSMEGSLLVGDFLFVSKIHYGSRMPITPIAFPLVHNMLPFSTNRSYSTAVQWGYNRGPRIQNVERYDPVVFNYPEEDTSYGGLDERGRPLDYTLEYHNILKNIDDPAEREAKRQDLLKTTGARLVFRPVDKRSHYIKRCVGLPGDVIEVRDKQLFVNGKRAKEIEGIQYLYDITPNAEVGYNPYQLMEHYPVSFKSTTEFFASPATAERLTQEVRGIDAVTVMGHGQGYVSTTFPYDKKNFPWNKDNYGPITIPAKGTPIKLSVDNLSLYQRLINTYEGNELRVEGSTIYINGEATTSYTPKMDYYWMMGDNRDNSADSRAWGYVPEDHIVGKPLFVWLSLKNGSIREGIRFKRMFKSAQGF